MTDTIEATSGRKATKGGLTGLKIAELKDVASRLGITGTGKMRKDDLVAAISSRQSGTAPASSCLLYTSPSPRDGLLSRMPSSA